MKKLLSVFVTVSCLLFFMASCSEKQSQKKVEEPVKLRWQFWSDAEQMKDWQKGIDDCKLVLPNIEITVENVSWPQFFDNLNVQIASNSVPDIFGMTGGMSRAYLTSGVMLDLTDYMERDSADPNGGWNTDDYYEGIFDGYTYKDRVYAVPYDMNTICVIYNVDIFEEFGVPIPDENTWTWDDYRDIARKLTIDRDGDGITDIYGSSFTPRNGSNFFESWILSAGSRYIVGTEPNQYIEVPEATSYILQMMVDGVKEGWNYDFTQAQNLGLFQNGQIAMAQGTAIQVVDFTRAMENPNVDVLLMPRVDAQTPYYKFLSGGGFAASATTKYPEECWQWIKNFCKAENLDVMVAGGLRGMVPLRSSREAFINSPLAPKNAKAYLWAVDQNPVQAFYFTCPGWNDINNLLRVKSEEVYAGMKTAKIAMEEFVQEGNAIIARGD